MQLLQACKTRLWIHRLGDEPMGDILYFDYGCVAFWGLTQKQEQARRVLHMLPRT